MSTIQSFINYTYTTYCKNAFVQCVYEKKVVEDYIGIDFILELLDAYCGVVEYVEERYSDLTSRKYATFGGLVHSGKELVVGQNIYRKTSVPEIIGKAVLPPLVYLSEHDDVIFKEYYHYGLLHKWEDPARLCPDDDREEWWVNGVLHREHDLPAVHTCNSSHCEWWVHGSKHREEGPAVVNTVLGFEEWWLRDLFMGFGGLEGGAIVTEFRDGDGVLHRDDDYPARTVEDGIQIRQEWWRHGSLHRDNDQPAAVTVHRSCTRKEWWRHGERWRHEKKLFHSWKTVEFDGIYFEKWKGGRFVYTWNP